MEVIQKIVRGGILRPVRKAGLALAKRWPWPVLVRLNSGRRMYVDLRSVIGQGVFMKGDWDPAVFRPLQRALRAGGTFLDIGSNVGLYSMQALDLIGLTGSIHAFEMDRRPLRCLRKTIAREQIGNLFVHEVAVGDHNGTVGFEARAESGHSGLVMHGGDRQVTMITLDSWWHTAEVQGVQAVKIDIEGAELLALEGAKEMLRELQPLVVCESEPELQKRFGYAQSDLLNYFAELNFRITSLDGALSPVLVASPK